MFTDKLTELERRLTFVESELAAARAQNQALRRRCRWVASVTRLLGLSGLIVFALFVSSGPPLASASRVEPSLGLQPTAQRSVHVIEAPVMIVGKTGNTIAEISEDQGRYGLTVHGPTGGSALIGAARPNGEGNIQLFAPGRKCVAQINQTGFTTFDPATELPVASMKNTGFVSYNSGTATAALGTRPNGSGFMFLGNPMGDNVVEAGMVEANRGIVRAYPIGGPTGGLGLPWAIVGKKK